MVVGQGYEIAALLPAAGQSRRLAPLSCSKELFPIRFGIVSGRKEPRSKVVSHSLLKCLKEAGIRKGYQGLHSNPPGQMGYCRLLG